MIEESQVVDIPSRQEQAVLAHNVGERLRESREMAGINQLTAAALLGYSNSSKLAKIEGGKDSSQIPMWVIKRCSSLYGVSVDYLLGNTENTEAEDTRHAALRETMVHMREHWGRLLERNVTVQQETLERVMAVEQVLAAMDTAAAEARAAMARIAELNPEWQDMRGGSRLLGAVERIASARSQMDILRRPVNERRHGKNKPNRACQKTTVNLAGQRPRAGKHLHSV